jgi:class 3 adenylate cyclase
MAQLPGGTVTFVFTDIEGSTRLLQELGDEGYGRVSGDHRRLVRETFGARGGTEIDTQATPSSSHSRARRGGGGDRRATRPPRPRVAGGKGAARADGPPHRRAPRRRGGLLGLDVVRAAQISSAGHGGQILISETTRALLGNELPNGVAVHDLGRQHLKDVQHEHIYELTGDGSAANSRPLKTHKPSSKSRQEDMASRFEDRITAYVEQQLEQAFDQKTGQPKMPTRLAFGGAAVGIGVLLMGVLALVAIAFLIKSPFF